MQNQNGKATNRKKNRDYLSSDKSPSKNEYSSNTYCLIKSVPCNSKRHNKYRLHCHHLITMTKNYSPTVLRVVVLIKNNLITHQLKKWERTKNILKRWRLVKKVFRTSILLIRTLLTPLNIWRCSKLSIFSPVESKKVQVPAVAKKVQVPAESKKVTFHSKYISNILFHMFPLIYVNQIHSHLLTAITHAIHIKTVMM